MESLWSSVFTPGTTPTLLLATNATFGALLLLLLSLLAFTRSIHFVILSILSAALWWSINWFAVEVRLAQEREEKTLAEGHDGSGGGVGGRKSGGEGDAGGDELSSGDGDLEGEKTEVEDEDEAEAASRIADGKMMKPPPRGSSATKSAHTRNTSIVSGNEMADFMAQSSGASYNTGAAGRLAPEDATRQRPTQRRSMAESTGSLSTDSEWEKIEGER